jgi:methylated-DNA-[protein]-cysteine S-methyltransferase
MIMNGMNASENRQIGVGKPPYSARPNRSKAMTDQIFSLEFIDTPTGRMRIVTDEEGNLRSLDWDDHELRMMKLLERHWGASSFALHESPPTSAPARALEAYFDGDLSAIVNLPTKTRGTAFQRKVWGALRSIPAGLSISYGALAARVGRPGASRAVGLANGANPIAIVVPCHRVIGSDASLTGYGGGLDRKRWLLAHEQAHCPTSGDSSQLRMAL